MPMANLYAKDCTLWIAILYGGFSCHSLLTELQTAVQEGCSQSESDPHHPWPVLFEGYIKRIAFLPLFSHFGGLFGHLTDVVIRQM